MIYANSRILLSIMLFTGSSTAFWAEPGRSEISARFSPHGGVSTTIEEALNDALLTIDVAMYSFSDPGLLATLKSRSQDGVKVRLLLNKANQQTSRATALEESGIDVRYVTPVMHHKFAIIDGPRSIEEPRGLLVTGSGNWSSSSDSRFDEDLLLIKNENELILSFQAQFEFLWQNSREFGEGFLTEAYSLAYRSPKVTFTSDNMEVFFRRELPSFRTIVAPEDGVAGKAIIFAIENAEADIKIATTHFRRRDIFHALADALTRGITIEMILDGQEYHSPNATLTDAHYDEQLGALGADVKYKTYSLRWDYRTAKQMHAKYMIIDNQILLTGSFNWSNNAEIRTIENLIRVESSQLASLYLENFEKIANYGEFNVLFDEIQRRSGQGPCSYDPVTLTLSEIITVRSHYAMNACQ